MADPQSLYSEYSEEKVRIDKLEKIKKRGINPYPNPAKRTYTCAKAIQGFEKLTKKQTIIRLMGRIRSIRLHGGSCFAHIEDETEKMQIYLRRNILGKKSYNFFKDLIDVGDIIEVRGTFFSTKKGEKTLLVQSFKLLTKSLLPLPEKWHGLTQIEVRYRKRYLDLIANPQVKFIFQKRSLVIKTIREFFDRLGFIEVETPVLQPIPGGAAACPFKTYHNALDQYLYLRIAPELYLKRLMIGGFEKIYEISRCFRNEGIDHLHNPEFTQIEFYQAYTDYKDMMKVTEKLLSAIIEKVNKKLIIEYEGHKINFKPPFPRLTFREALIKYAGIDIEKYKSDKDLTQKIREFKKEELREKFHRGQILEELYKIFVRPKIIQPTFIINHPIEISPLAKRIIGTQYVERFQLLVAGGIELVNAFSELNDPLDQEERFHLQERLRKIGDKEAQRFDKDFIEALKYGMPPTAGFGMGIDRLVMLLTNSHNIKEVILFPALRSKTN